MRRIISVFLVFCLFLHIGISSASETTDLLPGSKGDEVKELQFLDGQNSAKVGRLEEDYTLNKVGRLSLLHFILYGHYTNRTVLVTKKITH